MTAEHPFAQYVRILGKGPNLSRPLTTEETEAAVALIMAGKVEPAQLGAFLCLLRVKTETPEEVAGFVRGIRAGLTLPKDRPQVDLDWASWAGKARQLPWFLLSALLLAGSGVKVFMHGSEGHTEGRLYTSTALAALGVPVAGSLDEAAAHLKARNFAYVTLPAISPRLQEIMDLRHILGVRSPLHTVGRKLNIFDAPAQILSVTHPPYLPVHQEAARLIGQPHMAIFKGDGGEAERRPQKPCQVWTLHDGTTAVEDWPAILPESRQPKDEVLDLSRLAAVWRGSEDDDYARATVTGTTAIALKLMGRAASIDEAQTQADSLWENRTREALPGAA
ncbi:glycosyl transferase family protein [Novispirillum sp. DQ9]|uniref:glycosyl transferase family protein n=1 Tax=Novispirillum sp. DQ9 TaxID=3398612 RepID=UPI003C7CAE30